MRVFPPKEHRNLSRVLAGWSDAAQAYGFLQYKTSVLDAVDLYDNKTSDEIMQEQTYRFTDRGGRDILLRPEITPGATSMLVTLQKERALKPPYKVFSIGSVFRYENTQKGRSREHIQFNADLFGDAGAWADAEVITLAFAALENIGFQKNDFIVYLNDRATLERALIEIGLPEPSLQEALRLLDKQDKMNEKEFAEQLAAYGVTSTALADALREPPARVREIMALLPDTVTAEYNPKIVRGFDYYTGVVFELFTKDKKVASRSVAGGGRYDKLVESYGGSPLPAVGFGMGDVVLLDCLEAFGIAMPNISPSAVLYVTDEQAVQNGIQAASALRRHIPVSFIGVVAPKKVSERYKYYEQMEVPYVVGLDGTSFSVRTLATRTTETFATIEEVGAAIRGNPQ